jgi:N-acetylglucosaminyl-diphospho-decaprenol L-rhamnosyltransferase
MSDVATDVAAVIVDFHAGQALDDCVDSLHLNGVTDIVVVENGEEGSTLPSLSGQHVVLVVPKLNLGYGRGVNRGVAAAPERRYLLVSNPDVVVHDGAVAALVAFLDAHPNVAIVGPQILRPDGSVYPSQRVFPNFWLAGLHALLAPLWPGNPVHPSLPIAAQGWIGRLGLRCVLLGTTRPLRGGRRIRRALLHVR